MVEPGGGLDTLAALAARPPEEPVSRPPQDIADLDVLFAVLESPSDELAEAMKYDTVFPETMAILVAS